MCVFIFVSCSNGDSQFSEKRKIRHSLFFYKGEKIVEKNQNIKKGLHNLLLYSVFGIYILILFAFLFLKRTEFQSVNLVPFQSIMNYLNGDMLARSFAASNIIGNIVLFLPLGVYITLLNKNKRLSVNLCIIVLTSLVVEIAQYLFKVGATDIDDVILNTLGGLIGILIFKLIYRFFKEKTRLAIEILAPIVGIVAIFILQLSNM